MKIEEIPELLPLYYQEKQAIVTSDISDCNNLLPTLYEYIEKKKEIVGKYEYLEANFRNYKVQKQKEQDWTYRIKKWEHIIEMCRGKRNMICEQEKIEDQKLKAEQKKRDLAETFTNDWFENYENYVRNYTQFRSVNETLKNIQVELDKLNESILTSQKQKKDAEKEKIEISLQSKTWKTQLDSIAEQEKVLLKLEQENNLKIDYNLMEQIALYEQELSFLEEMQLGKISPLENSEDQLISWLKNLNETKCKIEENLNSKKEIENILEEEYGQMQEWIGNMETLLALAHKEIEKDNMCVCPICKAKYTDKDGKKHTKYFKTTDRYLIGTATAPKGVKVIGGKTGTTQKAGSCLILYSKDKEGNGYISVVLKAVGGESLYLQMNKLLEYIK